MNDRNLFSRSEADMKLLLHICCGPCSIYPVQSLRNQGFDIQGFFFNPNIHPYKEFQRRLETLQAYAAEIGLSLQVDARYLLEEFLAEAMRSDQARCGSCYFMRLRRTAQEALRCGMDAFSTTLLVSPYQDQERIRRVGEAVAVEVGIPFHYEDFRSGWSGAVQESRERSMYRQPYCGCIFSEKERYCKEPGKGKPA
jgi:epoxyqueuosine reductase